MDVAASEYEVIIEHRREPECGDERPRGSESLFPGRYAQGRGILADRCWVSTTALSDSPADDWNPLWLPDGTVAFLSDRDGPVGLFGVRPGEPRARLLLDLPGAFRASFATETGDVLALVADRWGSRRRLWLGGLEGRPGRWLAEHPRLWDADVAPDGSWVVFREDSDLLRMARGSARREILAADCRDFALSGDGRTLAWVHSSRGRNLLVVRSLDTGEKRVVSDRVPFFAAPPTLSPDGTRLFCAVWDREGEDAEEAHGAGRATIGCRVISLATGEIRRLGGLPGRRMVPRVVPAPALPGAVSARRIAWADRVPVLL